MFFEFKTKEQLLKFFDTYLIRDEELLKIMLLVDEEKLFQNVEK